MAKTSLCLMPQCIHSWLQESLIWACALLWAPGHLCLKTLSPDHWVTHTQEAQRPPNSHIFQEQLSLPSSHWGDYLEVNLPFLKPHFF